MARREETWDTDEWFRGRRRARELEQVQARRPMREYAQLIPEPGFGPLNFRLFPYQEAWYSDEVADAEECVWLKSTQVGMCLAPDTRVLTADLRWVELGNVKIGDELVSVDEEASARPRSRKMRRTVVTATWGTRRPARRLTLTDGRVVIASPEHRWLVSRGTKGHRTEWRPTARLRVGSMIRSIVKPWGAPDFEDGWFAGILDGEGHIHRNGLGAKITVVQCPGLVHERIAGYVEARGLAGSYGVRPNVPPRNPVGCWQISRGSDVLRLVGQLRPSSFVHLMGFWEGMCPPGTYGDGYATIANIEELPETDLIDLETTTRTFIAEGLVSHNSAYAWRWAVRRADQFGETGVYVFPSDTHVTEFGDERIEPAIEDSEYLRSRIAPRFVRHKRLKRIGRGFLHLRGSNSKAGAQSVAATWLVFDEYDFLDQTNLPQIERRISGARQVGRHPRIRRLGTPTIDGDGISAAFDGSDKRIWHVRCEGCGLEQPITWEENVRWRNEPGGDVRRPGRDEFENVDDVAEVWRQCRACEQRLDVARGRWIATDPERKVIGFHASRLIVPNTDLRQIVIASRRTKPQDVITFENNDLGRPFTAGEWALSQAMLLAACELGGPRLEAYTGFLPVTMGVDVAGERDLSVRIDEQLPAEHPSVPNPRRAVWIGEVSSFEALMRLIELFRPQVVAIDDNPERRMAKALRASYAPGRVVLVHYTDRPDADVLKVETGEAGTPLEGVPLSVTVHRTEAIDAMMDSIRQLRNLPLKDPPPRWFEQMRALKRKTVIDSKGRARRVYVTTGSAGDDYGHADVYSLVATELWRLRSGVQAMNPAPRNLPDEEIGFARLRLSGDAAIDQYTAGFGE